MASLHARSPLRSSHPLLMVNKIVSFTAFVLLLGSGWLALSYLKSEMSGGLPAQAGVGSAQPATGTLSALATGTDQSGSVIPVTKPTRLVYSCTGDEQHYHTSSHLPARSERFALSEEAALQRGLRPCSVCIARK